MTFNKYKVEKKPRRIKINKKEERKKLNQSLYQNLNLET